MPVCPQCDNRPFTNKEALLQHMKTSSAWHPFCSICDRRFSSQMAYDAHMADKHPPTFDCVACNRQFHAAFALEDHYRGSLLHPNCVRCGRGFRDASACEEHHRTAHPKTPCTPCGGILLYEDSLEQHYRDSGNHPSCIHCDRGFKENSTYIEHFSTSHPELYCASCKNHFESPETLQSHFLASPFHPKCERCSLGFADAESHKSHVDTAHTPTAPPIIDSTEANNPVPDVDLNLEKKEAVIQPQGALAQNTAATADVDIYSTGFTPLSPRDRMQALIVGERRKASPDLRLELTYASPLTEVKPLFSPTAPSPLPRPGDNIERFWTSRENITASRLPLTPQLQPNFQPTIEPLSQTYRYTDPGPSRTSVPSWFDTAQPVFQPREGGRRISPPQVSPPFVSLTRMSPQLNSTTTGIMTDFNSRLYPGGARQAMRAASLNRRSPPTSSEPSFQFNQGLGAPSDDFTMGGRRSFDVKSNRNGSVTSQSTSSLGRYRGGSVDWPGTSLFAETLTPTPKAEVSDAAFHSYDYLGIHAQNLTTSPSLATISSPASSALGHSPASIHHAEPDTRPTTASSTPSVRAVTYTITPSSECPSPRSPEVASPVGLGVLPTISPLASTPIDLYDFDFPEAKKPLPESPVEILSPVTVVLDLQPATNNQDVEPEITSDAVSAVLPIPLSAPIVPVPISKASPIIPIIPTLSGSPLSTSSSSYMTSPQEPSEDTTTITATTFTTALPSVETAVPSVPSPVTPIPLSATRSNRSTASTTAFHPNPLHCRVCLADTCDDITASMCGHIFCNRCITDAVIKTNRCPVCMTPTLLYCLFRLDLAA